MSYDKELAFAEDLAREAGTIMRRYFGAKDIGTTWKKDDTPVTTADIKINKLTITRVKTTFPRHGVLGEELSYEAERDFVWVVDPIDGTIPFTLGIPVSTFSIGLVDKSNGQPVVAVTYDPYLEHMYSARKGMGTFLNGKRVKTLQATDFSHSYVSVHGPPVESDSMNYWPGRTMDKLRVAGAKSISVASSVYTASKVASGEFAAVIMGVGPPWDVAAVALLVQESGGIVTDLKGSKRRFDESGGGCLLVANKTLHTSLVEIIKAP